MSLPAGAWTLGASRPVLRLQTQAKGRAFTLTAPISAAGLAVGDDVSLTLAIAIDKVATGSFLLDAGLRGFLAGHGAHTLLFSGTGTGGSTPVRVTGPAKAGTVTVDLALTLHELRDAIADQTSDVAEVLAVEALAVGALALEVAGSAVFADVRIPVPGLGSLDELVLDVHARLDLVAGP